MAATLKVPKVIRIKRKCFFLNDKYFKYIPSAYFFNPFQANVSFLHPLKTDNQRFFDVFRGYRKRPVAQNRLITTRKLKV